jgi:hypothetical protein
MADQVHDVYTGSDKFDIVVNHFGDARGIKNQFANSNPDAITPIIDENTAATALSRNTVAGQLASIKSDLQASWEGENADNALGILATLSSDAETIATNTEACGRALSAFQSKWYELRQRAITLDTGVLGTGLGEDNGGAHQIYQEFNDAMNNGMHAMPSRLQYHTPLSGQVAGAGPEIGGGGGAGAGGPIPAGMGSGAGFEPGGGAAGGMNLGQRSTGMEHAGIGTVPNPGTAGSGPGAGEPGALNPGSSASPVGYGPGGGSESPGPGNSLDPGSVANTGGGSYPPGDGTLAAGGLPGAVDPSTTLASYHPGALGGGAGIGGTGSGAVGGAGLATEGGLGSGVGGFGAPVMSAGGQEETRTSGIGSGTAAGGFGSGSTAGGVGSGTAGGAAGAAEGGRAGMMMPMRGAGSGDEDERERSTWLAEDDEVWTGEAAPPGVIR